MSKYAQYEKWHHFCTDTCPVQNEEKGCPADGECTCPRCWPHLCSPGIYLECHCGLAHHPSELGSEYCNPCIECQWEHPAGTLCP